jgi:hypothetical protein
LTELGYTVETQRFSFSTAGLLALPVFGAGLGWLAILEVPLLSLAGAPRWAAAFVWFLGLLSILLIAAGLGLGWSGAGGERREDANLIATRGPVRRWIVAHIDTKAQGHSMAGRLIAVWISVVAALLMTILVLFRLHAALPMAAVAGVSALSVVAGFLGGRGRLNGQSPGARDNGTGLLAVLVAAELVKDPATGILVTSAEEFGLIGARYFAEQSPDRVAGTAVINVDTVDERGHWRVVVHDSRGEALARSVMTALDDSGMAVRRHRLPAGIFVDSLPLARAGAAAITVARLDWGTLRVIHTTRDTLEGMTLESAVRVGERVAELWP